MVLIYEKNEKFDVEEMIDFAIENGASDVDFEENKIEILSSIPDFNDLRDKLETKYGYQNNLKYRGYQKII